MSRRDALAERVYRLLLRCYPGEFRDEYQREMLQAFRDRLHHGRKTGVAAILGLWWQVLSDSIVRAPGEHLDVLRQDLRYAARSLRRAPVFAATALLTLAIGVGANTAIFSIVHAVALRPLPFADAERVVRIWEDNPSLTITGFAVSIPNYVSWAERSRTLELAAWTYGSVTLRASGDPLRVPSISATPGFFSILGVKPLQGRLFTPAEDTPGAPPVAMIAEALWRRQFGGDPAVIGSSVMVAGTAQTIVGVLPEGSVPGNSEFFAPLRIDLAREDRSNHTAQVIGRIKPGVTFDQARLELESIAQRLEAEFPDSNKGWGVSVSTLYDWLVPDTTRRALFILMAAVCSVLLIACANVANLMLARAAGRRREVAVRLAIGAGRRRLVRQMLTEGLVLAVVGGGAGVLLAHWSMPLLKQWLPADLPRAGEAAVSGPVLLFSLAVCAITALIFGALPALASARADVLDSLKQEARGHSGGSNRARQLLAGAQVALATMLLVAAGLLGQSLLRLERVDLGFDPSNVTTAMMGLPSDRYSAKGASWAFYQRLLDRLGTTPAVEAAALTSGAPFDGGNTGMPVDAVGPSRLEGKSLQADWRMVSPSYFRALGIPVVRGQTFTGNTAADGDTMIVSAGMARRIWGDEDPIGKVIKAGPAGDFRVVGVVGDVRNLALALEANPTMYISTARYLWPSMTIVVRSRVEGGTAAAIRSAVRELDPQLAVYNVRTTAEQVSESAAQPRLNASLVGLFALVAAVLAALGIYGVLAYLVSQRRQEIGIRMALGAGRPAVLRLFLGRGLSLSGAGVVAGVAGALAVSRWIESIVFGVSAKDPWTFAAAVALVALVALVASYIPARRATRVDPLIALRSD